MLRTLFQRAPVQLSDIDAGSLAVFFGSKGVPTVLHPPIVAVGSRGETESLAIAWNLRLASSSIQPDMGQTRYWAGSINSWAFPPRHRSCRRLVSAMCAMA
jgi:hypothetical protein